MSLARDYYDALAAALEVGPPPELDEAAALLELRPDDVRDRRLAGARETREPDGEAVSLR